MAKFINKPIIVKLLKGKPETIFWLEKAVLVKEILEHWKDTGCWWNNEGEKDFYRLVGANQNLLEIFFDNQKNQWYLYKIYD